MTSKTEGNVATNYGYDFENRLTSVGNVSQYFYNGEGVRLQKIENGKTTRYVIDANGDLSQTLCETDGNGTITVYYVYGVGLAYKVDPNGAHYYYSFDPIGSTIAMTDDAKNVVNSYAYDPFGTVTNKTEGTANPFQYVGQLGVIQDGNGLQFMRARYYFSQYGRFLSRDPLKATNLDPQELNQFSYTTNNPTNRTDAKGLLPNPFTAIGNTITRVGNSISRGATATYNFLFVPGTGICGPQAFPGLEKIVPEAPLGFNISEACKHHDENYALIENSGLSDENKYFLRAYADVTLRDETKAMCQNLGGSASRCTFIADTYYGFVRAFGPFAAYGISDLRNLVNDYFARPLVDFATRATVERIKSAISSGYNQILGYTNDIILVKPVATPSKKN